MKATFPVTTRTVAPTFRPLTLDELKQRIPVTGEHWDSVLVDAFDEALERFRLDTGIVCCTSTWQDKLDDWPDDGYIRLQNRPAASVSSITYLDSNGTSQTWGSSNYTLDTNRAIAAIFPTYNATFPALRGIENSVTITYVAGYSTAALVPGPIKIALVLAVKHYFGSIIDDGEMAERSLKAYEQFAERYRRASYP